MGTPMPVFYKHTPLYPPSSTLRILFIQTSEHPAGATQPGGGLRVGLSPTSLCFTLSRKQHTGGSFPCPSAYISRLKDEEVGAGAVLPRAAVVLNFLYLSSLLLGQTTVLSSLNLQDMLPENLHSYYSYQGSLTTPPCTENVHWFVLADTVKLSRTQVMHGATLSKSLLLMPWVPRMLSHISPPANSWDPTVFSVLRAAVPPLCCHGWSH